MYEQRQPDHDGFDFAEIWSGAQYRRNEEARNWLSSFFSSRPRNKSADPVEPQSHRVAITA
jgi:hypothetical protein